MDVSVIIPLYNGKKYIKKLILMLEKNKMCLEYQEYKREIEIIFINDNPQETIEKQDIGMSSVIRNITLISNCHNLGIHRTRIKGLERAVGSYVVFLDQDDEIAEDYLFNQFYYLAGGDAVLCNGFYRKDKVIYYNEERQREAVTKQVFIERQNLIISPGQVMIKRDAIPKEWKCCYLYENGSDDVLLWILMLRDNKKFSVNPFIGYFHIENGGNASLNFSVMKKSIEELYETVRVNDLLLGEDFLIFEQSVRKRLDKYDGYIRILDNWEKIISGLGELIRRERFRSIAIYGYGVVGRKLLAELGKINVSVDFFIDKDAVSYKMQNYDIYSLEEVVKDVGLIIITPLFAEDEIRKSLEKKKGKKVSLQDFL